MNSSLSLLELNALVRETLEAELTDEYWVRAELSEVRVNSSGHCYVEFVQKSDRNHSLLAKARGIIWSNVWYLLKAYFESITGQPLCEGIKVLVKVSVSFHELYGYSLIVSDIDPKYTLGDLAQRRLEILRKLDEEGVLHLNQELSMPLLPQRVAVISSPTAAGFGDFCNQLRTNAYGFYFQVQLFSAVMQGQRLEASVLQALDRIYARNEEFDVVVIIRGGGATSELADFDSYLLASACAQFPLPIITGIGHERDDTVLDTVAHTRVKTPTAAAEFLIQQVANSAAVLDTLKTTLFKGVKQLVSTQKTQLETLAACLPAKAMKRLADAKVALTTMQHQLSYLVSSQFQQQRHFLALWNQKVDDAAPERLLARGYSLALHQGKALRSVEKLQRGDTVEVRLQHGSFTSIVTDLSNKIDR